MTVSMRTLQVADLGDVVRTLGAWQSEGTSVQLHPGDVGWFWRFGAEATAAAVRSWHRDGATLAVGLLDSPDVLRLALAPGARDDDELAHRLVTDLGSPHPDLPWQGKVVVEAPAGALVRDLLQADGWTVDQPWTPLRRHLADPVPDPGVELAVVGPELVHERCAVQRAAFEQSTFTEERWHAMAGGPAYADARCLVAYDDAHTAVAAVTVWSAGPGRPGLLEPMGVHRDHRGRGYGTAITLAAAAALRELGSSSAVVCTRSSNLGGVATYRRAGFEPLEETPDLGRSV